MPELQPVLSGLQMQLKIPCRCTRVEAKGLADGLEGVQLAT